MKKDDLVKIVGLPEWYRGMFGRLIKKEYLSEAYDWEINKLIGTEGQITHTIQDLFGNENYRVGNQNYYYPESSLEAKVEE